MYKARDVGQEAVKMLSHSVWRPWCYAH